VHLGVAKGVFLGVLLGSRGCSGCILSQKRLGLSSKVDECKPLVGGHRAGGGGDQGDRGGRVIAVTSVLIVTCLCA